MSNTVIGIFEYADQAREAQQYLLSNGFTSNSVDVKTSMADLSNDSSTRTEKDEDFMYSIGNFFKNLFGDDDDEVNRYSEVGRKGTIVTVHASTSQEAELAAEILDKYGAVDVNEKSAGAFGGTAVNSVADVTNPLSDATSIPVIEEELLVGKREVQTGGVRLRSRIVERPVEESVRLRQEYVSVERTPVDRVATEADFNTFKEGTIEEIERAEVPVVSKEARIVEEVSLRKEVEQTDETVRDTVRRTEVETDNLNSDERIRRTNSDI